MPVEIDESTIFEADTVLILETLSELNSDLCGCFRIRQIIFHNFISIPRFTLENLFRLATPNDIDKVLIQNDPQEFGCWSRVGKQNGTQIIQLSEGCFTKPKILHEIYHSIGFYHEHSRPDRDKYVEVHEDCIREGTENDFKIFPQSLTYGLPYEPRSFMHYKTLDFNNGLCATITSKIPGVKDKDLGSAIKATELDILKVKRMYKCGSSGKYE